MNGTPPNNSTRKKVVLRLTGRQHARLQSHLLPGDGCEAVAVALCGRHQDDDTEFLMVHRIVEIPYDECERAPDRLHWTTERLLPLAEEAAKKHLAILKVHSHPGGWADFSKWDDRSDLALFPSLHGWTDDERPHASAVMLPDGRLFGRAAWDDGTFTALETVQVAGDDLQFWPGNFEDESDFSPNFRGEQDENATPEFMRRHAQLFGRGTTERLRRLSVAVVGCSGTGSPTIEQLARLGVKRLVLVDPDRVEEKNLNRIYNTRMQDADEKRFKVDVLAGAVRAMELDVDVVPLATDLADAQTLRQVASCDLVFGCMDGSFGRNLLNVLSSYYLLPYFDMGVRLVASEDGGIDHVCGSVNYLQPDGSNLLARHVYTIADLHAEGLKRQDPEAYAQRVQEKYIRGVREDRPAVISVNTLVSALAVNEMLARLHPFRLDANERFAKFGISLEQGETFHEAESDFEQPDARELRFLGRGELTPFLNRTDLEESVTQRAGMT